jgi:LysR family transcriptional activator of glutamate synthase operon
MDAIKGLVTAGIGVTLLPESSFYDSTPRFTVKIPIETPIIRRTVGIISPATRELSPSEKVFHQFVTRFFTILGQYQ